MKPATNDTISAEYSPGLPDFDDDPSAGMTPVETTDDDGEAAPPRHRPQAAAHSQPELPVQGQSQEQLFSLFYRELHRLARRQAGAQRYSALPMGVTTLLHEAYIKVAAAPGEMSFATPGHFIAYAARAMRSLMVDHARRCSSHKHGGDFELVRLDTYTEETLAAPHDILRLDEHLNELHAVAPDLAQVVELKFFCGLSFVEIAQARGCSERTVYRDWEKAKLLLAAMLRGDLGPDDAAA